MTKKDVLIVLAGIFLLALLVIVSYFLPNLSGRGTSKSEGVVVLTDKEEYLPGDSLKVKIENNENEKICFSSCYPYYIQRENGTWKNYDYEECNEEDVVESCIDPNDIKSFEITLPSLKKGPHRLLLSACLGCEVNNKFLTEENIFSNPFVIK